MPTTAIARICANITLEHGKVIELHEGDIVRGLTYKVNGKEAQLSGAVRVINVVTRSNTATPAVCPPEPYSHRFIAVSSLVIDSSSEFDAELTAIDIDSIISIDAVEKDGGAISVGVGDQYKTLNEVISSAPAGSTVKIAAGTYEIPLTLDRDISIVGDGGDVVLTGPINIEKNADGNKVNVHIDGVRISGEHGISLNGAESFTLINSVIGGLTPEKQIQPVHFKSTSPDPVFVTIENNEFLPNNDQCYNLINIYAKFMDGSSISKNIFRKGCCTHNNISFFDVDEGAAVSAYGREYQ